MKSICFYFQIHQPFRLKRYRFFDIGLDHYYYDDFKNEEIIRRIAANSYLPANETILKMIKETNGAFKVAYSISGVALEQLERCCPEVIDSFKELAKTGCVEFLGETYAHSLASLKNDSKEFELQVAEHSAKIEQLFGKKPTVFRNSELIYTDEIGVRLAKLGFSGAVSEGASNVLGWKSPNYVYCSASNPRFKLLFRNTGISEDISYRFSSWDWSEFPLTAEKLMGWIGENQQEQVVNLFMNYEVFGEIQNAGTGIFEFLKALPIKAAERGVAFTTPSEAMSSNRPVDQVSVSYPVTWANQTRDVSPWLANGIQQEAFNKVLSLSEKVRLSRDSQLLQDWYRLQSDDHLYYMSTSYYNQTFCPYDSPYDAFINYMNVVADFVIRLNSHLPKDISLEETNALVQTITRQEAEIAELKAQLSGAPAKAAAKEPAKKPATKKAAKPVEKAETDKSAAKKTATKKK